MPLGIQVIGSKHHDARVTGIARWIAQSVSPVSISRPQPAAARPMSFA
jgi:hypothetical protein